MSKQEREEIICPSSCRESSICLTCVCVSGSVCRRARLTTATRTTKCRERGKWEKMKEADQEKNHETNNARTRIQAKQTIKKKKEKERRLGKPGFERFALRVCAPARLSSSSLCVVGCGVWKESFSMHQEPRHTRCL